MTTSIGRFFNHQPYMDNSAFRYAPQQARIDGIEGREPEKIRALREKTASFSQPTPTAPTSSIPPADTVEISRAAYDLAAKTIKETPEPPSGNKVTPSAVQSGREGMVADLDQVLSDLRRDYGEAEAMRRFDEFMKADGWEVAERESSGAALIPAFIYSADGLTKTLSHLSAVSNSVYVGLDAMGRKPVNETAMDSRMATQTMIQGYMDGGQERIIAATWATFTADTTQQDNALIKTMRDNSNDALTKASGTDIAQYIDQYDRTGRFVANGTSSELARLINGIFGANGLSLNDGEALYIRFVEDGNGDRKIEIASNQRTDGKDFDKIKEALNSSKEFRDSVFRMSDSISAADMSEYGMAYEDASGRGTELSLRRQIIFSADESQTAVMGDLVGIKHHQYTYQKKISDVFDPNADIITGVGGTSLYGNYQANKALTGKIEQMVLDAVATGKSIQSNTTDAEYNRWLSYNGKSNLGTSNSLK